MIKSTIKDHLWFMNLALEEALKAHRLGEVPVGAILVDPDGKILYKGHNLRESTHNPVGHAEILAMYEVSKILKGWRLTDCTLYCTLEPCLMCLGAMIQSRIGQLVFGAYDSKGGAISLGYPFFNDTRLNHTFDVVGGVRHFESSKMLSDFFKMRRASYNS